MKQVINYQRPVTVAGFGPQAVNHRGFAAILALALVGMAGSAFADATCEVSTSGVSFGFYDVFGSVDNDATGNISVACTGLTESTTVAYDIVVSAGSGSYALRSMASGSHHLNYNLYTDSNRVTVWADGGVGSGKITDGYSLGLTEVIRNYPIYGRIPARQNAFVGSYSDTPIVTINY
jgi:spore coat protein U-like protein